MNLNGEHIYAAFTIAVSKRVPATPVKRWPQLTDGAKELYNTMAMYLNEQVVTRDEAVEAVKEQ